jgi:hypothetical protein
MVQKNSKKSIAVCDYFIRIEKEYLEALRKTRQERSDELIKVKQLMEASSEKYNILCSRRDKSKNENTTLIDKHNELLTSSQNKLESIDTFTEAGVNKYKAHICLLKNTFFKVPIYAVNPVLIYEKWVYYDVETPYNLLTEENIGQFDSDKAHPAYYCIGEIEGKKKTKKTKKSKNTKYDNNSNYHFVTDLYVEDNIHLEKLKQKLHDHKFSTKVDSTYFTTFDTIKDYSVIVLREKYPTKF